MLFSQLLSKKRFFIKCLISTSSLLFMFSLSIYGQDYFEIQKDRFPQMKSTKFDAVEDKGSLREDQFSIGVMPGATWRYRLKPKFSYSLAANFKFNKKGGVMRFWIGGSIDHSFLKSKEKPISNTPLSDTTYVTHWNIAMYAFHLGWDIMLKNDEKSKFYLRGGLNGGSYIHRSYNAKYYSNVEEKKLVDESYSNIGQPAIPLTYGISFGFGYEYNLKTHQSISFTPTCYARLSSTGGFVTLGLNAAYNFGLSKNNRK